VWDLLDGNEKFPKAVTEFPEVSPEKLSTYMLEILIASCIKQMPKEFTQLIPAIAKIDSESMFEITLLLENTQVLEKRNINYRVAEFFAQEMKNKNIDIPKIVAEIWCKTKPDLPVKILADLACSLGAASSSGRAFCEKCLSIILNDIKSGKKLTSTLDIAENLVRKFSPENEDAPLELRVGLQECIFHFKPSWKTYKKICEIFHYGQHQITPEKRLEKLTELQKILIKIPELAIGEFLELVILLRAYERRKKKDEFLEYVNLSWENLTSLLCDILLNPSKPRFELNELMSALIPFLEYAEGEKLDTTSVIHCLEKIPNSKDILVSILKRVAVKLATVRPNSVAYWMQLTKKVLVSYHNGQNLWNGIWNNLASVSQQIANELRSKGLDVW